MSKKQLEEIDSLDLQYDAYGLLPAIVQDGETGIILMMAYVNAEAFNETVLSGFATFWSRSRQEVWKKGETSGNRMKIKEILVDCDQDCIIYVVEKTSGGACHTKNKSGVYRNTCFYRVFNSKSQKLGYIQNED